MEKWFFLRKILRALNPLEYENLSERSMRESLFYLPGLLLVSIIVAMVLSIPFFINIPNELDGYLSKVDAFSINVTFEQNDVINIPSNNPILTINKQANSSEIGSSKILITNKAVVTKPTACFVFPSICFIYDFGKLRNEQSIGVFSDILKNKDFYIPFLTTLFFTILPLLIILAYILLLIQSYLFAFIFSLIAFFITRIVGYDIRFVNLFKIAICSLTVPIILRVISFSVGFDLYHLDLAIFLVYFILGIIVSGYFDNHTKRGGRKRLVRKGYIDISK